MHVTYRLSSSLILGVAAVSLGFAFWQTRADTQALRTDLDNHARVLAESLAKSSEPLLQKHSNRELQRLIDRFNDREQIAGVAVYDVAGQLVAMTSGFPWRAGNDPALKSVPADGEIHMAFLKLGGSRMHMATLPLRNEDAVVGTLVLLHDASYIDRQALAMWRRTLAGVL